MTRSEFDQQIRELKNKRNAAIREVAALQSEIKEEIAAKNRMILELGKEIQKLKQSLQGYYQRRIALGAEWNSKINAFIKENVTSTTSNLAEANTLNIIYELRRRGFKGVVKQLSEDGAIVLYLESMTWIKPTGTEIMRIRTKRVKGTADANGGL